MAERLTLGIFLAAMLACLALGLNIIYGLAFGLVAFFCYARYIGLSTKQVLQLIGQGLRIVMSMTAILLIIGMLSGAWRASGTIPFLVYQATAFINPGNFLLICFLLCCVMSMLMGSALGTTGTIGVICMMLSQALGINPLFTGGAVLAGAYFGDRGSPVSASANLVCTVTKTNIYQHVVMVAKNAWLPFLLACLFYWLLGFGQGVTDGSAAEAVQLFYAYYQFSWWLAVPAITIILLSVLRVDVKINILISILGAYLVGIFLQGHEPLPLLQQLIFGYRMADGATLANLMDGGGLVSMLPASVVVLLASTYFGIFRETPLLDGIKQWLQKISTHISPFGAALTTSTFVAAVCCNQTMPIMLTNNICEKVIPDNRQRALVLANTATLVAPLIPWNVALMVPMMMLDTGLGSIFFAFYIYLVPLLGFAVAFWRHKRLEKQQTPS